MKYAYASDVGNYREENEDTVAVFKVDDIFTVALLLDGMGGARGGKIASETACMVSSLGGSIIATRPRMVKPVSFSKVNFSSSSTSL